MNYYCAFYTDKYNKKLKDFMQKIKSFLEI